MIFLKPVITGKFSPFTENLLVPVNEILYRTIIMIHEEIELKGTSTPGPGLSGYLRYFLPSRQASVLKFFLGPPGH
jgi:hypothetical protein